MGDSLGFVPISHGRCWHAPVHIGALTEDQDPGVVLYNHVRDKLLPVFDAKPHYVGHRPWEEAFDSALSEVMNESAPAPQAPAEPAATVIPTRTRRTKPGADKADPPAAAEPKPRPTRKRTPAKPATS